MNNLSYEFISGPKSPPDSLQDIFISPPTTAGKCIIHIRRTLIKSFYYLFYKASIKGIFAGRSKAGF